MLTLMISIQKYCGFGLLSWDAVSCGIKKLTGPADVARDMGTERES